MHPNRPFAVGRRLVLVAVLAASSGCASIQVDQSYRSGTDFARYRTFALMSGAEQAERFGSKPLDAARTQRIEAALAGELTARGLRAVPRAEADLAVAYIASTGVGTDGSTYGRRYDYNGYSAEAVPLTKEVKEGSMMVDLVDARTGDLVWRGYAKGKPGGHAIEAGAAAILAQYPPER